MSDIIVSKKLGTKEILSADIVAQKINALVQEQFDKYKKNGPYSFTARVKTKLFNPIIKVVCGIEVQDNTVNIKANTKPTFWFFFGLMFVMIPITIPLLIFMWFSQKGLIKQGLENMLNQVDYDLLSQSTANSTKSNNTDSHQKNISALDELERLHKLKIAGAITEHEYEQKKNKLIA